VSTCFEDIGEINGEAKCDTDCTNGGYEKDTETGKCRRKCSQYTTNETCAGNTSCVVTEESSGSETKCDTACKDTSVYEKVNGYCVMKSCTGLGTAHCSENTMCVFTEEATEQCAGSCLDGTNYEALTADEGKDNKKCRLKTCTGRTPASRCVCVCVFLCMCVCVCMYVCIQISVCVYMDECVCVCVCVGVYVDECVCVSVCVCVCVCVCWFPCVMLI
jgi:hypothetical protein